MYKFIDLKIHWLQIEAMLEEGKTDVFNECILSQVSVNASSLKWPCCRDRCYVFLNIFAEKFGEKISVFDWKQS
jgi:hypothetical protein